MASSKIKVEKYRKGRARGAIYTVPSGARCYLEHSKISSIFRAGEQNISNAVRKDTACWGISEEILLNMRAKGIRFVGVLVRESNDIFLTQIENYFDPAKTKVAAHRSWCRFLPFNHFSERSGKVKL